MAYILNLETATKNCSVSVAKDGITVSLKEFAGEGYAHAEKLHIFIEEALGEAGISLNDLSAIAVSKGPGSYTGLRIGVSAAKGLCYALNMPMVAIDTTEVLAHAVKIDSGIIMPMIDARRMEAYTAVFSADYKLLEPVKAEIIEENIYDALEGPIHLLGDGAAKCKPILVGEKYVYHDAVVYPSAKEMSALSFNKYKISDTVDVAYFEPFYLKNFIAGK
ncbi:peptidase M22 [Flavobacterium akiainvivens]|uniref:Peptidase M22 n=1 Tax=Flavobacterium akiainvivens TaxID=1202724 RepID=A0A0M9VJF6_9FLAO|nr:tRNA (adenosine(37)-N6)-threonylcarbamoyltransferase complex dimerization subunit type 1 TsaB [Flavobacterium akiainvivens]KOS07689.1 peptidase M22 [Flavobacterium akiainvivens]SFQ24294.1 tRNA threonylcarbamoyladenosine biosynthesis protein TsaB [Flavobacterium akiainvivens]